MIEISEYAKKQFRLRKSQLHELSKFIFYLNKYKNLSNPVIKIIDKESYISYKLYLRKPLYKNIGGLFAYVD